MFRSLLIAGAVALAPLFAGNAAEAQVYTTVTPPTAVGYVPVRTGLFGLRTTIKPVLVPGTATTVVNRPVVTTNYAPTTTYYAPAVQSVNYAAPTTSYYTPTASAIPTTTYYTPTTTATPTTVNYYPKTYWYSTQAPVPRSVGMPIIGY